MGLYHHIFISAFAFLIFGICFFFFPLPDFIYGSEITTIVSSYNISKTVGYPVVSYFNQTFMLWYTKIDGLNEKDIINELESTYPIGTIIYVWIINSQPINDPRPVIYIGISCFLLSLISLIIAIFLYRRRFNQI